MSRRLGFVLIAISAASFGATPVFARIASEAGVDTVTMLALRFAMASALLWVVIWARGLPIPTRSTLLGLVLLGAIGYVGQSFTYFTALTLAPASLVVLLLYLYPVVVALASTVLFGERMTLAKGAAMAIALAGTVLTIGRIESGNVTGVVLAITCGVLYAGFILVASRITPGAGAVLSTAVFMSGATSVYTLVGSVRGFSLPTDPSGWWAIVAMAVLSTVVASVTFFEGLKRVGPTSAATLSTVEPAVAVVLAALFLGEQLTWLHLVGGTLILLAALILARTESDDETRVYEPEVPATVDPDRIQYRER